MDIPVVRPRPLRPGETIAIVAPAGPVSSRDEVLKSVATLEAMGFRVAYSERIFSCERYLAGPDPARAEELMGAIENPDIHAILSLRGGYGCSRLISLLDPQRIRNHCKIFMGFSDVTTLHLYLRRCCGWITLHGPMTTSPSLAHPKDREFEHLRRTWTDPTYTPTLSFPEMESWMPGIAEGELTGGCLSLVAASIGTSYEPVMDGKILFLEDLGEPPYRLDRMLTQLELAHKLDRISGVVLGNFQECDLSQTREIDETLIEKFRKLQVPVLAKFPSGHGPENWVLPLGARVRIDAYRGCLELLEPACSSFNTPDARYLLSK
jgi:muramoyltetrapeptide carboxypeptidase